MPINNKIQLRRGTSSTWAAINSGDGPVLAAGEPGFQSDGNLLKIGDGSTSWKDLKPIGSDQSLYKVKNTSGGIIYKGQVVRANGTVGNSDAIQVTTFIADGSVPEYTLMGLATQDMNNNDFGYVTAFGQIRGVDTDPDLSATNICAAGETWLDGDILYASPSVSGKLTKVKPQHDTIVAIVLHVSNNGSLFVRPSWNPHLDDIHDVNTSGLTNNQYLIYNSGSSLWLPTSSGIFEGVDISSSASGATLLSIEGTNGNLFSVVDSVSGSLLSVNDITGLSAFEVFSDHSVVAGRFNKNDFVVSSGGNVGIGTSAPSGKLHIEATGVNVMVGPFNTWTNGGKLRVYGDDTDNQSQAIKAFVSRSGEGLNICVNGTSYTIAGGGSGTNIGMYAYAGNGNKNYGFYSDAGYNFFRDRIGIGTENPTTLLDVSGVITASGGNSTDWNTAFGWGNHASGGYLTSLAHNHGIANSAGTQQFTFGVNDNIRFAGGGSTSVTFNSSTKLITISSTDTNTTYSGSTSVILSGSSFERAALTGDVTATQNNNATTIANDVVTNAKMANMAVNTIKGRITTGTGDPEDLTAANVRTIINVADGANNYVHPTGGANTTIAAANLKVLSAITVNSLGHVTSVSSKNLIADDIPDLPWSKITSGKPTTLSGYGITDALASSLKGANNGLAELDSGGKVPSSQLPSYVDDVLEYATLANFPATGETGKIYVATGTNLTYRWSGSAYVEISASLALGETSSTAYRGDRGKTAYDHSQVTSGAVHGSSTVGTALLRISNNSTSIKFIRVNADNTLAYRTAAEVLSDIGATNNVGTVTSVGGTGTVAGLTLTGTVTTTGSLTLGGTLSTPVSTINDSTTLGQNLVKLTNPSAIRFLRINANNTVDTLTDSAFRTAIGAGTSSTTGTVTSVASLTLGTTGTDVSSTVTNGTTTPVITLNIPTASASNRGALSSTDWTTFNNKQAAITGGASTITSSNLTVSRALVSDGSGKVAVSDITSTELSYLDNVSSNIQTQLNSKTGGTGTTGKIPKWSSTTALTDSIMSESSTVVNIAGSLNGQSDESYLSFDANSNRVGITKKGGFFSKFTYGSAAEFAIAQSNATNILPTGTFTDRFIITSNGTIRFPGLTSNGFLKTGSSNGTLSVDTTSYQTLLTNPVTGTGTTNYISKWTSASAQGNSIIFDNGTDVGIGTNSPSYKLQVNGSFGATTKSFRIDHPSKPDYTLEYGSLESPYHGVRLTGRGRVVKGVGVVDLPPYLKDLIHDDENINIQLTNLKHGKTLYVSNIDLNNSQFTVRADRAKTLSDLEFFWTFSGVRKDVDHLVVEKPKEV